MAYQRFEVTCSRCRTVYTVSEEGTRFPWNDREEYSCPVCGELGGTYKTRYNLNEEVLSLDNTLEDYKNKYLEKNK